MIVTITDPAALADPRSRSEVPPGNQVYGGTAPIVIGKRRSHGVNWWASGDYGDTSYTAFTLPRLPTLN